MSRKVTPKQRRAVHLLASGQTQIAISRELKLRPETLSRWKRRPEFQQEFEKVVNDLRSSLQARLLKLAETSVVSIENQLGRYSGSECDAKRVHMALNVLKLLGFSREPPPYVPETTPKEVILIDNGGHISSPS